MSKMEMVDSADYQALKAKADLYENFIEEITVAGGEYADLNGNKIVVDAYAVLTKANNLTTGE